ncbi:MAG: hypothetical protein OEY27_00135, partial [Gammaproteobacteria bacterium]|nr:hypothetical protein [Gammaproteobacteria bacterium]
FQTTSDAAGTIPVTTVSSGNSFYLAVTVRNLSSVTQSSVNITNLTAFKTGSWQGSSPSCGSPTPASLSLNAGASGKIVFTCTTNANDSGTVYFTANARNGTGSTVTSRTAQSNSLAVGKFTATLKINTSPNTQCAYLNGTMTVTMDLTNGFTYSITGITPSALTVRDSLGNVVTGVLTLVSGPTPASVASIAAANPPGTPTVTITNAFTWTYRFDGGNAGETYSLSGTASGTASGCASNCGRVTPISTSTVKRGGYSPVVSPSLVNASSINVQLQWSLTNNGCTHVKKVAIAAPSGWTLGNDPYSLIEQSNPPNAGNTPIENAWLVTTSGNTTDFTAQSPPSDSFPLIPASPKSADIALVVNTPVTGGTCPATPAMNNFTVTITDLNNVPVALTTGIGVCQFGYGVGNKVDPSVWREIFH